MNNAEDLARQKRDYEEQIFQPTSNAEMKHTPTAAIQHIVDILETKNSAGIDIEIGSTALKSLIRWSHEAKTDHAHLIAQNEAMRSLLQQMLDAAENADETGYVADVGFIDLDKLHAEVRAALNPPPTK